MLPEKDTCIELLEKMLLIRRFEERAGEMYMRAKIGGFLHLAIGEEATVVGTISAMHENDYLLSTYREHGQALARGMDAGVVMSELFGRVDGCCKGRGGSMHLFDFERRFLGGYGIVGGNLPIAAGVALASQYKGTDDVTVCMFGDGASNQGTFGETMNLAALWTLPIVFICVNNQYGMGTALKRHSAITDLSKKAECLGVPGDKVDGMDVVAVRECITRHLQETRDQERPVLVEFITYRFRGHSAADPEQYRSKKEVEEWRKRDPIAIFRSKLEQEGVLGPDEIAAIDSKVMGQVEAAVEFADSSPQPPLESLYDDIYALGDQVQGWYSLDERTPAVHRGEEEQRIGAEGVARELAEAGAAHGSAGEQQQRRLKEKHREDERKSQ